MTSIVRSEEDHVPNRIGAISLGISVAALVLFQFVPLPFIGSFILYKSLTLRDVLIGFSEAALVGSVADWFAVTALFRNPLGIALPHTNLLAKKKDMIADAVPKFLMGFAKKDLVTSKLFEINPAAHVGHLLSKIESIEPVRRFLINSLAIIVRHKADGKPDWESITSKLVAYLPRIVKKYINVADIVTAFINFAQKERWDAKLFDSAALELSQWMAAHREKLAITITRWIKTHGGWQSIFVGEGTILKIVDGFSRELANAKSDKSHELRQMVLAIPGQYVDALANREGNAKRDKLQQQCEDMISDKGVQARICGIIVQGLEKFDLQVINNTSNLSGTIENWLRTWGNKLETDSELQAAVNLRLVDFTTYFLEQLKVADRLSVFLAGLIKTTDEKAFVGRVEAAVWNDLQYIRLNGAVVGGLVGLIITLVRGAF